MSMPVFVSGDIKTIGSLGGRRSSGMSTGTRPRALKRLQPHAHGPLCLACPQLEITGFGFFVFFLGSASSSCGGSFSGIGHHRRANAGIGFQETTRASIGGMDRAVDAMHTHLSAFALAPLPSMILAS